MAVLEKGESVRVKFASWFATIVLLGAATFSSLAVAQQPPSDSQRLFEQAMARRAEGDIDEAIKLFQSILSSDPSLNRARLELAVAYLQALNFEAAKAEAEKVLRDPNTPQDVRANIQNFLATLERERAPNVFTPFFNLGYMHDSNVNVGPASSVFSAGGNTFNLVPGAGKQSDNATTIYGGLSHRYLAPKTYDVGGNAATLLWQSQASLYHVGYNNLTAFDLDVVTVSTGPALIVPRHWRANLGLQIDEISIGHSRVATYSAVNPNYTFVLGRTELALDGQVQRREFHPIAFSGRTSDYLMLGATLVHLFPGDKFALIGGIRSFNERADLARFSNDGNEYFVGANWFPWKDGNVYVRLNERTPKYKDVEPIFNIARDERESRLVLGFSHKFGDGYGYLKEWVLSANYTQIRNHSNVATFVYDRSQAGLTLGRSF